MKVLNIDIDYFLDKIPYGSERDNTRKPSDEFKVWEDNKVIDFIEEKFSLSLKRKIRGRIIEHHEEAFYYWRELIEKGDLEIPFKLCHVDSHIDMSYLPDGSWKYILELFLKKDQNEKLYPEKLKDFRKYDHFGCDNYLLYVLANGWLSTMEYFYHPKLEELDFPPMLAKVHDIKNEVYKVGLARVVDFSKLENKSIFDLNVEMEYELPIKAINIKDDYHCDKFDFIVVSKSPKYTPVESDRILNILSEYIVHD